MRLSSFEFALFGLREKLLTTELEERIPAAEFTVRRLDALLKQIGDPKWNKSGFHLRRPWPKDVVVTLADGVVHELAELDELQRLCEVVNGR